MALIFEYDPSMEFQLTNMDSDEGLIIIEISSDGAISFPGRDMDADIMAFELGDDPSEALELLHSWQEHPITTLFTLFLQTTTKTISLKPVLMKIVNKWIKDSTDLLFDRGCVSEVFKELTDDLDRYITKADPYSSSPESYIKDAILARRRLSQLGDTNREYYIQNLSDNNSDIHRAIYFCHDIQFQEAQDFHRARLINAIRIIQEEIS